MSTDDKASPVQGEVRLTVDVKEYQKQWNYYVWEAWIVLKLKAAGVPVEGEPAFRNIKTGDLMRFDDPEDFGKEHWVWKPNAAAKAPERSDGRT